MLKTLELCPKSNGVTLIRAVGMKEFLIASCLRRESHAEILTGNLFEMRVNGAMIRNRFTFRLNCKYVDSFY